MRQGKEIAILLGVGWLLTGCTRPVVQAAPDVPPPIQSVPVTESAEPASTALLLETHETDHATVFVVTVPTTYTVSVVASETLQTVAAFAQETSADVVLNAGFFDPVNGQTTSHIVVDGAVVAAPADNARLVENPDLTEYLDQILNRSEFRRYDCDNKPRYEIAPRNGDFPGDCTVIDAIGAGPQLLPTDTSLSEAFTDVDANGQLVRDAIGSLQRNARSAVGLRADGTVLLYMVAQRAATGPGMTLAELAAFMQGQGIEQALNLDGGSSSSLVFEGEAFYGRLSAEGQPVIRPVKSVLIVQPHK
ncbi:MAG: phosphodiester glycosidase family protein [Cyanobacteria bacterium J06632_22]